MRLTYYIINTAVIAAMALLPLTVRAAQPTDTVTAAHTSVWHTSGRGFLENPAMMGQAYATSYSELRVSALYDHQSEPFVLQKGSGESRADMKAESYLRLSDHSAVWGSAHYGTGRRRNIVWNSTSDYDLLEPYILADTIGGDTRHEVYGFSGGYGSRMGRLALGADASFRTEHEYRDVDPRMRGIVSDLTLRAGMTLDWAGMALGASFTANVYKQTNSVAFFNELGVAPEYQMTGLGTVYTRFSGDKRTLYYEGGGYGVRLHAEPSALASGRGLYADLLLEERHYKRIVADLNSMPLTKLVYNTADLTLGWKSNRAVDLDIYLRALYTERSGDEYIAGTAMTQYYPITGRLTLYKNYISRLALGAVAGRRMGESEFHVSCEGGYESNRRHYVYPARRLDASHVYGQLGAQMLRRLSAPLLVRVDGSVRYDRCVDDKLVMPFGTMGQSLASLVRHEYRYASADMTSASLSVRADRTLSGALTGVFCQLGAQMRRACSQSDVMLTASLGVTF